jgi:hypothetical protein
MAAGSGQGVAFNCRGRAPVPRRRSERAGWRRGDEGLPQARIIADAAHAIFNRPAECTGSFFIDEVLAAGGV